MKKLDCRRHHLNFLIGALLTLASLSGSAVRGDITIPLVHVGDQDNPGDLTGHGCVTSEYWIGMYEVTNSQYTAFLNSVAATDTFDLFNEKMRISRKGTPGGYSYSTTGGNLPVTHVSFFDALRFVNWLNNDQPGGAQDATTTEDGAYTFTDATTAGPRNAEATFFLPDENEWYKAAYYQGGPDGEYWLYPGASNTPPIADVPGDESNLANYDNAVGEATIVGSYPGSAGPYGTFDQGGNVWEWNETIIDTDRGLRGGSWDDYDLLLESRYRDSDDPESELEFIGFRVATSEPPPEGIRFRRGFTNEDGTSDIADAIRIVGFLFLGDARPTCLSAADTNDDGAIDIADGVALLNHLFTGGAPLPPPALECDLDPTPDELGCASFPACE